MECSVKLFNVGLVLLYYFEIVHYYNAAVDAILKKASSIVFDFMFCSKKWKGNVSPLMIVLSANKSST